MMGFPVSHAAVSSCDLRRSGAGVQKPMAMSSTISIAWSFNASCRIKEPSHSAESATIRLLATTRVAQEVRRSDARLTRRKRFRNFPCSCSDGFRSLCRACGMKKGNNNHKSRVSTHFTSSNSNRYHGNPINLLRALLALCNPLRSSPLGSISTHGSHSRTNDANRTCSLQDSSPGAETYCQDGESLPSKLL